MKQPLPRKPTELERLRAERDQLRAETAAWRSWADDLGYPQLAECAAVDAFDKEATR